MTATDNLEAARKYVSALLEALGAMQPGSPEHRDAASLLRKAEAEVRRVKEVEGGRHGAHL